MDEKPTKTTKISCFFKTYFEQKNSKICKFNTQFFFVKYVDYDFMAIMNQHPLAHHAYYYSIVDEHQLS